MSERFFVEHRIENQANITIGGPEADHIQRSMRLGVGDELMLFDGSGKEFRARIIQTAKRDVELQIVEIVAIDRESPREIHLAVALPKGDRQKWLVEKLVELGAAKLIPLASKRGVALPVPEAIERLKRQVIEASKQCGRNRLMEIAEPLHIAELCKSYRDVDIRWFATPHGGTMGHDTDTVNRVCVAIGPEGGFDESELAMAQSAGWKIVSFGPRILRVETAAIAAASFWGLGGR